MQNTVKKKPLTITMLPSIKKRADAQAQKMSAEDALANLKKQVATATTASQTAERTAKDAETAAAKAGKGLFCHCTGKPGANSSIKGIAPFL